MFTLDCQLSLRPGLLADAESATLSGPSGLVSTSTSTLRSPVNVCGGRTLASTPGRLASIRAGAGGVVFPFRLLLQEVQRNGVGLPWFLTTCLYLYCRQTLDYSVAEKHNVYIGPWPLHACILSLHWSATRCLQEETKLATTKVECPTGIQICPKYRPVYKQRLCVW